MEKTKFKVVIAEDEGRIRENIARKIPEIHPRYTITAKASTGKQALEFINSDLPDLLITDIKMPVMDGMALIEELYFSHPELPVIILSGYDDFSYAKKAIRFGVRDYILKPASKKELAEVLERLEVILDKNISLMTETAGAYDSTTAANELCGKITEFIKARYTEDISIAELADNFKLNPTYMSRVFKARTGRSPTRFLTELRINRAKKLLTDYPELEIKEISIQLGFQDQNYFSRLFKKEAGVSPLEYRGK